MTDTADQNPDHDKIPTPSWDLEDDTKPAYIMDLREWLPYENTKFDNLIKNCSMIMKDKLVVSSAEQAVRINNQTAGTGTYEKPCEPVVRTATTLHDSLKDRYIVMPELIDDLDGQLFRCITRRSAVSAKGHNCNNVLLATA